MNIELGIIEGFYGRPWTWSDRADTMTFLAQHGYRFYLYAPKADPHLRRLWRDPHPIGTAQRLARLAQQCREQDVRFGIGLSPSKIHLDFNTEAKEILARKLAFFDELGAEDVALLFDDMRGDLPDLAQRQVEIVHWAAERSKASRFIMCPSYYTDDPVLERVFGHRPPNYLETLGARLDPAIEMFWTGEEVVSRQYSVGHLERVSEQLHRKPFIWDNYPVNDGERMSQYLYVRGFTGRPAAMRDLITAHGVNPALQPMLTRIPALTLVSSYQEGDRYEYGVAMRNAARLVLGSELGQRLYEDVLMLQDVGLDRLVGEKEAKLRERYGNIDHPAAREIIAWLSGEYRITDEIVREQAGE
ncbi:MAG: beta-N-acetylglucosaminidase domain-containing protein [Gemmatimonadota bacterium]